MDRFDTSTGSDLTEKWARARGIRRALDRGIVAMGSGDACPANGHLLAFSRDDGSVARMAVVRATTAAAKTDPDLLAIGRYVVGPKIASGGMATVHLGRVRGAAGFARTVAIKRLLPELASDPEFVARFVDEARIASRVRHANVVPTIDVVDRPEVLLVLEYVHGESLARLLRIAASRGSRCPPNVASAIVIGVLRGLHVAHEAKGSNGVPLDLVHRDVSPQNVIVGADGVARMLDFGIAKASGREQSTLKGSSSDVRGKLAYMAPEQISGEPLDRRADLFAAGVMLWEALAGDRLFRGEDAMTTMDAIFHRDPPPLAGSTKELTARVDEVLATALAKDASARFSTADDMARAIEGALPPGSDREVADWVESIAAESLGARAAIIARFAGSTESGDEHEAPDATTQRRSPLLPAPLPRMRDEAKTVPAFDAALAEPPAARAPVAASENEPLRTPLSMVAPLDPLARSGMSSTRIEPIDLESKRPKPLLRTPIPMPAPAQRRRLPVGRLAALLLAPSAIAAIVILAARPAAKAPSVASAPLAATIAEPVPVAATAPPILTTKVIEPPPRAAATAPVATTPSSRAGRSPRAPWGHSPRRR